MQFYIDHGCQHITDLIDYFQESFPIQPADEARMKLSQIKAFYDDIPLRLNPTEKKTANNNWCMTRILLLVRRVSRTLAHILAECRRKNKGFAELLVLLNGVYSECEIITILGHDLTDHKLEKLRQFEAEFQYEEVLYEREIRAQQRINTPIDINILKIYLTHCIMDNSLMYVNELVDDLDEFLLSRDNTVATENQENLKQCLCQLQIPLEVFLTEFEDDPRTQIERDHIRRELACDRHVSSYIDEHTLHGFAQKNGLLRRKSKSRSIIDIFKNDRYIILLGDPGSGKSTFMRFCIRNFADNLLNSLQTDGTERIQLPRIPILIRLASFTKQCAEKESLSILEYIQNTGNSIASGIGEMLKGEVIKGNCLLLFDGLDEVFTFQSRCRVVHYVQSFIEEFALTPAFISPFDSWNESLERSLNGELPSETSGNQIIMTSRFIGYDATVLVGHSISHYVVPPLGIEEKKKFIDHWFFHVNESVNKVLNRHNLRNSETCTSWVIYADQLKQNIEKSVDLFTVTCNFLLLSMICARQYFSNNKPLPTLRIQLYQEFVASVLRNRRLSKQLIMSESMIRWILEDVATYIHREEPSGIIDRFVLKRVCVRSLKAFYKKHESSRLTEPHNCDLEADNFIRMADHDANLLVARGQQIYGFMQMVFQEYFACLRLVRSETNGENIAEVLKMLLVHIRKPRFLLPVSLGLEWLSCNWTSDKFNLLCKQLISYGATNQELPVGAMLLIETSVNLNKKPADSTLFDALDRFARAHATYEWFFYQQSLGEQFCFALEKLRTVQSTEWLLLYLRTASSYEIVDLCFLLHRYVMSTPEFPEWLDTDICMLLSTYIQHDIDNNEYAVEQLLCLIAEKKHERLWKIRANSKGLEALTKGIAMHKNQHHPLILAVMILLHGGLCGKEFNSFYIHRDSAISIFIAEYYVQVNLSHAAKVTLLLERCDVIIHEKANDDTSLPVLDAFTTLLCLKGMHDRNLCEKFKFHRGFYIAIRRLKNTLLYLRKQYNCRSDDFSLDDEFLMKICAGSKAACRRFLETIRQSTDQGEDNSISIQDKILASEYTLAFIDAIAISLASLTLRINYPHHEIDCTFSLFKWRMPFDMWTNELRHLIKIDDLSYNITRVIPEWISFLSMIIYSDDGINICYEDDKYMHKQLVQSISDHTHIFYYAKDHPLFLLSFIRPHRRALLCRFMTMNSVNVAKSFSNWWTNKMGCVYLLTECLNDFPHKYDNNVCLFAFLILLLEQLLNVNRIQHFALVYFLKIQRKRINTLKNFLRNLSGLFPWAQTIESFDTKSARNVIEEQRQLLAKAILNENDPERDFELYTACISLAHLSTIQSKDINALRSSVTKEVEYGALKINASFYKAHALSYCSSCNSAMFLENLPYLSYFLMVEKFGESDINLSDVTGRLNRLFHDQSSIEDRRAVYEALLPVERFRRYILDKADVCLQQNDFLMLSRALRIKSPIFHFYLDNTNDSSCEASANPTVSYHACLYLALLVIDAQSLSDEFEEQPITNLDHSKLNQKLQPSGYPPCLSKSQAYAITEYLKTVFISSKLNLINMALHRVSVAKPDTYPYIRQWFQYQESSDLKLFAWHASRLLPIENIQQMSILLDIFQSDNDDFLRKVTHEHFTISLSSDPSLLSDMTERMIQAFRSKTSPFPFSFLKRLIIDRVELLLQLFQAEQRLICAHLECNSTENTSEVLQDEQQVIWKKLQSDPSIIRQFVFDTSNESLAKAFISEIYSVLDGLNTELLSTEENRCLYLLSLQESFGPFHDNIVNEPYIFKRYMSLMERFKAFIWKIILASKQESIRSRLVLRKCVLFYCKDPRLLTEYNMSVIQKIATEAVETDLREMLAVITDTLAIRTLYLNNEKTREYRNRLDEAYGTHTAEYDELTKVEQIGEYINKHHSLLPVFAKDFIYSLSIASQGYDELSQASIYGQIADHLCKASTRNFHMAIRQNPQGELQFKKLLYKTKSYEHLAYYGELTSELLELIFALDPAIDDDEEIEQDILPFIITIANRSVLEQLYEKLMSKYSFERLLAGRLLVHLASCDAISAQEANDKILIAIQDSFAQQQMKWFHADNKDCRGHDGLAQQMGLMLLQLSFAHRNPLTSSSPLCHEPTFVFHYAKQIRNQVVCLFTTNEILHVVETDDSNDTHYIDDDNNNGDIDEDDVDDDIGEDDVDGDIGEDDVDGDIGEDDSSG